MRHSESAFIFRNAPYEYMMMYFGLIEDPTYYMDLMNKEFMEYLDKFIVAFINDVLVHSMDEEHEEHLCLVLQKL
jgi:hypothetical protein